MGECHDGGVRHHLRGSTAYGPGIPTRRLGQLEGLSRSILATLLYEAANVLITRVRRFSPLKSWAVRLATRKGFKKVAVAAARKFTVVMLRLWRDETPSPGSRRHCQHDDIETTRSVLTEQNAVPPGRRQSDLVFDDEAEPYWSQTSQPTFGNIRSPTPSWGEPPCG